MNRTSAPKWAGLAHVFYLIVGAVGAPDDVKTEIIASQPCWVIESSTVRLAITLMGAHMAPVTFCRDSDRTVQPYYVSPWQDEGLKLDPRCSPPRARKTTRRFTS